MKLQSITEIGWENLWKIPMLLLAEACRLIMCVLCRFMHAHMHVYVFVHAVGVLEVVFHIKICSKYLWTLMLK